MDAEQTVSPGRCITLNRRSTKLSALPPCQKTNQSIQSIYILCLEDSSEESTDNFYEISGNAEFETSHSMLSWNTQKFRFCSRKTTSRNANANANPGHARTNRINREVVPKNGYWQRKIDVWCSLAFVHVDGIGYTNCIVASDMAGALASLFSRAVFKTLS